MSVDTEARTSPAAEAPTENLPREFRGDQKYGLIATVVALTALLFSSYIFGTSLNWGPLAAIGVVLGVPTLLGAIVLFFKAYDTFAKKLVVDAAGLKFQHHSTVLLELPWADIEALVSQGEGAGRRRYIIRTAGDSLTIANLERQDELLSLLSRLSGRPWEPGGRP